jgi:hypothetical protein
MEDESLLLLMIITLYITGQYQHIIYQNDCLIICEDRINLFGALEGIKRFGRSNFNNGMGGVNNTVLVVQQNECKSSDIDN